MVPRAKLESSLKRDKEAPSTLEKASRDVVSDRVSSLAKPSLFTQESRMSAASWKESEDGRSSKLEEDSSFDGEDSSGETEDSLLPG